MEVDGPPSTVMPQPAVTLTFDLLTLNSNEHICEPKCTSVTKNGLNSLHWLSRYDVHEVFGDGCIKTLKTLNNKRYLPNYSDHLKKLLIKLYRAISAPF